MAGFNNAPFHIWDDVDSKGSYMSEMSTCEFITHATVSRRSFTLSYIVRELLGGNYNFYIHIATLN